MVREQEVNEYDVIVLGSGLGGLVAGTLLSRKQRSVLALKEKSYQPSYQRDGYHFFPFSNFSERRLEPNLLAGLSQILGLPLLSESEKEGGSDRPGIHSPARKVAFQVILPNSRIDLFRQMSLLGKEWKREFPNELSQVEKFYSNMEEHYRLLKKGAWKENTWDFVPVRSRFFFEKLFLSEPSLDLSLFSKEFRAFLQLQMVSWGNFCSDRYPVSLAAYLLSSDEAIQRPSHTDLEDLEHKLLEEYLRSGGKVEEIEAVEKVDAGWRRGFTVQLGGDRRIFHSECLVLSSPVHCLPTLSGRGGKLISKWSTRAHPGYVLLPFFLGIRERGIPTGMNDLLVSLFDLERRYDQGNLLFISLSSKSDPSKAPEGRRALTVESLIPYAARDQISLVGLQEAVMKHVFHLFPFLGNFIDFIDTRWAEEQISRWSYPHFRYVTDSSLYWKEGLVPTRIAKNLFLAGKENFPYLGVEGEVLGGWEVARQILKK